MVYKLPPAEFSENFRIPQKSKWRRNVTRYLHKLEVGEFYRNCETRTFYLEWFGHGWRPKFEIWRGIPGNSDVEFHSNLRGSYLPWTSRGSPTFGKIDLAVFEKNRFLGFDPYAPCVTKFAIRNRCKKGLRKGYQRSCVLLTVTPQHSRDRSRRESNNGIHARWLGEVEWREK